MSSACRTSCVVASTACGALNVRQVPCWQVPLGGHGAAEVAHDRLHQFHHLRRGRGDLRGR